MLFLSSDVAFPIPFSAQTDILWHLAGNQITTTFCSFIVYGLHKKFTKVRNSTALGENNATHWE